MRLASELEIERERVMVNGAGGMDITQTQAALRYLLREHATSIYVPHYHELIGDAAGFNLQSFRERGYQAIVYAQPYGNDHQVAVKIDLSLSPFRESVYNSRKIKSLNAEFLQRQNQLCKGLLDIHLESSFFNEQVDDWSCGVHVIANLLATCQLYPDKIGDDLPVEKLCETYLQAWFSNKENLAHQLAANEAQAEYNQSLLKSLRALMPKNASILSPLYRYLENLFSSENLAGKNEAARTQSMLKTCDDYEKLNPKDYLGVSFLRCSLIHYPRLHEEAFHFMLRTARALPNHETKQLIEAIKTDLNFEFSKSEDKKGFIIKLLDELLKENVESFCEKIGVEYDFKPSSLGYFFFQIFTYLCKEAVDSEESVRLTKERARVEMIARKKAVHARLLNIGLDENAADSILETVVNSSDLREVLNIPFYISIFKKMPTSEEKISVINKLSSVYIRNYEAVIACFSGNFKEAVSDQLSQLEVSSNYPQLKEIWAKMLALKSQADEQEKRETLQALRNLFEKYLNYLPKYLRSGEESEGEESESSPEQTLQKHLNNITFLRRQQWALDELYQFIISNPIYDDALQWATALNKPNAVRKIIQQVITSADDADLSLNLDASLKLAILLGNVEVVNIIFTEGKSHLNLSRMPESSPLPVACLAGQSEIAEILIRNGASLESFDIWESPLYFALRSLQFGLAKILIANGVEINRKFNSTTLLNEVIRWDRGMEVNGPGGRSIAIFLLEQGADPALTNQREATALMEAVTWGRMDVIKLILKNTRNSIIDFQDSRGRTALHFAASAFYNSLLAVKLLLIFRADFRIVDKDGMTALMHALALNKIALVRLLLPFDENPLKTDNLGRNILMLARRYSPGSIPLILKSLYPAQASKLITTLKLRPLEYLSFICQHSPHAIEYVLNQFENKERAIQVLGFALGDLEIVSDTLRYYAPGYLKYLPKANSFLFLPEPVAKPELVGSNKAAPRQGRL